AENLQLARGIRISNPVVEAAALERIVHFTGSVGRNDDDRRGWRLYGAEVRHGGLEGPEHFQKKGLEGFVRPVDLIDQEHWCARRIRLQRLEQWALDEETLGKHVVLDAVAVSFAFRFS